MKWNYTPKKLQVEGSPILAEVAKIRAAEEAASK